VNDVSLDGSGKAKTMFIASTNAGSGMMTATATGLKAAGGNSLPDTNTNLTANILKVELKEMWEKDNRCNDLTTRNAKRPPPPIQLLSSYEWGALCCSLNCKP